MKYQKQITADYKGTYNILTSQKKDHTKVQDNHKEFFEVDRNIRDTQIGHSQKDRIVGEGDAKKMIPAVRIPVHFQREIVDKAVAFQIGAAPTITPNEQSSLSDRIMEFWESCRMHDKLQEAKTLQMVDTECALMFWITDKKEDEESREIKVNLLQQKNGNMAAHFDEYGRMDAFVWEFATTIGTETRNYVWIFDDTTVYKYSDIGGQGMSLIQEGGQLPHGFKKVPIVYLAQDFPEWYDVQYLIDRYETSLSRLVDSNDYSGHPILALYGEVLSMPEKDNSGKTLNFEIVTTEDGKIEHKGDAKFITYENAPESVKLEIETEESKIYKITQTPNLAFENLKGLGAISGIALEFMFMDATMKASKNEGKNRTIIQRCLNLFAAGVSMIDPPLASQQKKLAWNVQFNSILPKDLKEKIDMFSTAVQASIVSKETAVQNLDIVSDVPAELERIKEDQEEAQPAPAPVL